MPDQCWSCFAVNIFGIKFDNMFHNKFSKKKLLEMYYEFCYEIWYLPNLVKAK